MRERDEPILYPDNPAPHITDWLFEIGPTVPTGMGEAAISWEAMDAWCNRTGVDLDPWECRTLRKLSQAFINQRHDAKKPDCPAPYSIEAIEAQQAEDRVTEQFRQMKLAFANRAKRK